MMGGVWSIVLAAGSGQRYRPDARKQYEPLAGRRVLDWSLDAARAASDGVVLVVAEEHRDDPEPGAQVVVVGGDTRSASVRAGLAAVPAEAEVIVVHDAARPLAGTALFHEVVAAVAAGADAAIPVVALTDTVKQVVDGRVVGTPDRAGLVAVQTPQAFRAMTLRAAHEGGAEATDDAALVEQVGGTVLVVPGNPGNLKITHAHDLAVAEVLLGRS